ncbi:hypothetical protein B0H63DRAFT_224015 [Podospora didyma]|uniref:GPI-anchored cell wall organization protein Ecm33 n=1 Tax=Podospora didyma TaxID=330526 RepID=A0AAE0KJ51_9PEZI|nr:hypothetical protein B0H63DRAFT_224015 [Podospora didyma]
MLAKILLPTLVAIGSVSAQSGVCTFTSTQTYHSQAEATALANCKSVKGSIVIASDAQPNIDITGPSEITGDLSLLSNNLIETFKSDNLAKIGGNFEIRNVTKLGALRFPKLTEVSALEWFTLNNLDTLEMALSKAVNITISDTFLQKLDGIDVTSINKFDINNNRRLTKFSTKLGNVSDTLTISSNGLLLQVDLPNLIWIKDMQIANVTKFSAPSLATVNNSAKFDFNYFTEFLAPNLTSSGVVSFIGNPSLTNLSFPLLQTVSRDLSIANNTALKKITGFPELEQVSGAVLLRGTFDEADFPAIQDVKGAFDVASSANITASCDKFKPLAPANQGGNGLIQGVFSCEGLKAEATDDTGSGGSGSGSNTGGGKKDSGAAGLAVNTVLFGVAALGVAQFLL